MAKDLGKILTTLKSEVKVIKRTLFCQDKVPDFSQETMLDTFTDTPQLVSEALRSTRRYLNNNENVNMW